MLDNVVKFVFYVGVALYFFHLEFPYLDIVIGGSAAVLGFLTLMKEVI